jgi:hypothetical protein
MTREGSKNNGLTMPLLPYYFRLPGYILIMAGSFSGYLYFFGGKPAFFESKVFAIVSTYLGNRYFAFIQTNLLDEMAAVGWITGLVFIAFSEEKVEKSEYPALRLKSLICAVYGSALLWIFTILFFYGYIIVLLSPLAFISFFIFFHLFFKYYQRKTT